MSLVLRLSLWSCVFTALAGPLQAQNITNVTPSFGSSTDPNFIEIYGSGFSPGTVKVWFNGVLATTAAAVANWNIQATVPAGAPLGTSPIKVQIGAGTPVFSPGDFTVIGPGPYVTDFNPPVGSAGTVVTLQGAHFTGVNNVTFNGRSGTSGFVQSDNSLQITAPAGVSSGPIVVTSPKGSYTALSNFFVPPSITGFSPTNGRTGTNVLITGTNFLGTTAVRFGSIFATNFTVFTNHTILVKVPSNALTGVLRVDAPAGSFLTSSNFIIQPTVFSFSPPSGPIGAVITINGANLNAGTPVVKFNGATATIVSNIGFSQLSAVVPSGASSGPISITTSNGVAVSTDNFYLPATITTFTPNKGLAGTRVTVTGSNFTNASAVSFNGQPSPSFTVTNNTTLGVTVPQAVTTGPISVTTPAGTSSSALFFYGVPSITSFSPTHGLPHTNVVLSGSNFLGVTSVTIAGQTASFIPPTDNNSLTFTIPEGAQSGPITIVAPGGTNTSTQNFILDYSSDLAITVTESADPVTVTSNLVYTFFVSNGGPFPAPNVTLTNTLSSSVALQNVTTTQGTVVSGGSLVRVNLGTLATAGQAVIQITVKPQSAGVITNTAVVESDYQDLAITNNTQITTTTVLPLPLLSIREVPGNRVRISWPVALTNYALQFKPALADPNLNWSNVVGTVTISGNEQTLTETNSDSARFYRLQK